MNEAKYLDYMGLGYYNSKIKEYILSQVGGSDVTIDALKAAADGAVSIEWTKGGTKQADVVLSHADLIAAIGEVDATEAGLMSVADKAKLDAIEAGAQVNVIESISINGEAFAVADKAATATMTFDWEAEGSDNIVLKIGETEIGKIDTTKFVKDGIVEDAELITIPGDEEATEGRPAGKYIKITWSGSATTDPTYINVTDLVDIHNVVGDTTQSGSLVKVNTAVTGSGTTTDPWKVSVAVDETALQNAIDGIDTGVASLDGVKGDITVAKAKTGMGEVSFAVSEDGELSGTVANVGVQSICLPIANAAGGAAASSAGIINEKYVGIGNPYVNMGADANSAYNANAVKFSTDTIQFEGGYIDRLTYLNAEVVSVDGDRVKLANNKTANDAITNIYYETIGGGANADQIVFKSASGDVKFKMTPFTTSEIDALFA